ncbi:MAG: hypothetical protein AAF517_06965 [Planctomycetota bacterium]
MTSTPKISSVLIVVAQLSLAMPLRAETHWIEGEDATKSRMTRNGWYDGVKPEVLSGAQWISHFDNRREGTADYQVEVKEGADFAFWVRANHVKSRLSYRVDSGAWKEIDLSTNRRGALNIAKDNKPDLRFLSWNKVGTVQLERGSRTVSFRFHSRNHNHGALDCFLLTTDGHVPSGKRKPSARKVAGPADWFDVPADDDAFSEHSLIDMSELVEAPAGKHGFLNADGDDLRFENSKHPVKLWGLGSNLSRRQSQQEMEQSARWYRKLGINLVRQHTVIADTGLLENGEFDAKRLDRYDRWFAILKQHGIYTCWSVIYPHHGSFLRKSDRISPEKFRELDASDKQHDGSRRPIVVNDFINLDRELQDVALKYFRALLEHRNPYTKLRYKDDPALAIVEFQNESNAFFHTLNDLRGGKKHKHFSKALRERFFEFTKDRYGTKSATLKAWGSWDRNDRWDDGELGLMVPFHWGADGPLYEFKNQRRRCGDYLQFLATLQRSYYERRGRELRGIGFRGVTVTTAWKGVGASSLPNLWCDSAADMIDRHNYFGGGAGRHAIVEGKVNTESHLSQPGRGLLNVGLFQIEDKPFAFSEWTQMPPNPWKAEAAPLIAFYGMGLQGWDASCHFACSSPRWGSGWPNLSKYSSHTPHYLGQFPALAFAIHRGHLKKGDVVASRQVGEKEIFSGYDTLGQSIGSGEHDVKRLGDKVRTPPELLAVGRVTVDFDTTRRKPQKSVDTARFWDRTKGVVNSTTGELRWDYRSRRVEVRSARTQALIGFAPKGKARLPDVTVEVDTKFCSLIFTPLDDRPLALSKSVLITAMARDKQTGTKYSKDGTRLTAVGGPPLRMEPVQARVLLRGAKPKSVRPLDLYGVPRKNAVELRNDGSFRIDGRHRSFYYHVAR